MRRGSLVATAVAALTLAGAAGSALCDEPIADEAGLRAANAAEVRDFLAADAANIIPDR
jgi:hypothetical protein